MKQKGVVCIEIENHNNIDRNEEKNKFEFAKMKQNLIIVRNWEFWNKS